MLGALLAGLLSALPQGGETFKVRSVDAAESPGGKRVLVEADRRAINCLDALQQLGDALNWNVVIESQPLQAELAFASVDLAFADQDPRVIGQLIATAGGADTVFDPGDAGLPMRPTLHVVREPDAGTESGRQRLRTVAAQWYRSFLVDELRFDPVVRDEGMQARMHLGHLLIESGDLDSAITFFKQVYDDGPHDLVPEAMLRIGECYLELAAGQREGPGRQQLWVKAEEWARKLLANQPSSPAATRALAVLGKALIGQQRFDECRTELGARVIRLVDGPGLLDVWLLIGEAQFRLGWPTRVYETMLTLRESPHFANLGDAQFLDYHFLLGCGAAGAGKLDIAMRALEWFLVNGSADRRRGTAFVALGETYLAQNRYVEARAAAVEARQRFMPDLDEPWRRRAIKLFAASGLALGDRDEAFRDLETLVHRQDDPELTLYLVDALLADRQWQWAISVARLLLGREDSFGDDGRLRTVRAMFEQGSAAKNLADFPAQAIPLVLAIRDSKLRSECAELIGQAYEQLGKPEHAADAYRGILR